MENNHDVSVKKIIMKELNNFLEASVYHNPFYMTLPAHRVETCLHSRQNCVSSNSLHYTISHSLSEPQRHSSPSGLVLNLPSNGMRSWSGLTTPICHWTGRSKHTPYEPQKWRFVVVRLRCGCWPDQCSSSCTGSGLLSRFLVFLTGSICCN